jgi:hypothetical protein
VETKDETNVEAKKPQTQTSSPKEEETIKAD